MSLTSSDIMAFVTDVFGTSQDAARPSKLPERPALQSLLGRINNPAELRSLGERELGPLADELRQFLLESVSRSGGHLAAGLGVVDLTVALHYVFDTPRDTLVWDVGHQGYPHKVLTGRRDSLPSIRRRGGLSGFLRRDESPYDAFGAGHSSTSISAALGIALAEAAHEGRRKTVAVIGDGALTAGLAFEALEHAGAAAADLLIVLNDNGMSISPNVGSLSQYLGRLSGRPSGGEAGRRGRARSGSGPVAWLGLGGSAASGRPGQFFEDLGITYLGSVDGEDLESLVAALRSARACTGPRLLHVRTRKGAGYAPAVADPIKYHGVTPFDPVAGIQPAKAPVRTYTDVFGEWLCQTAAGDRRLAVITPAMREGSGLVRFAAAFPDRYFDVGIAEQHSVTLAAGLATRGMKPVVAIYSTFLQRGYDQLIHDVAVQRLPVLFAIDRAGLVGPDGATHCGSFDLAYLRCIPGMTVMTPSDGAELRDMLNTGLHLETPAAVRYPRAAVPDASAEPTTRLLPVGKAERRREGRGVALLVFGTLLERALAAAERLDATVVNMRFVKPLDVQAIRLLARTHDLLVTLEENTVSGGAGSAVNECLAGEGLCVPVLNLGLPDRFIEHGTRDECLAEAGLDRDGILAAIARRQERLAGTSRPVPA